MQGEKGASLGALFARDGQRVEVHRRAVIHHAGEPMNHVFRVVQGWFSRSRASVEGAEAFTGLYMAGDLIGADALSHGTLDDNVTALCEGVVLRLPLDALRAAVRDGGEPAVEIASCLASDTVFLREALFAVGTQTSRERLTAFFTQTYHRLVAAKLIPADADRFDLPLTQVQLGAVTGITPVHINRVLHLLRTAGPFTVRSGVVRITDRAALATTGHAGQPSV